MSPFTCQHKDKTFRHYIKHPSRRNRYTDVVLLHRELYLNLNRHTQQGRASTNIDLIGVVYTKYQQALDKRRNVLGRLGPLKKRIGIDIRVLKNVGFRLWATF